MNDVYIHPSAHVSKDAKIGSGSKVWINVQIREGAVIGSDCIVSKDVYIDNNVKIGDRCKIQNSVSVYHGVSLGADVFVGPNVSFTNDKVPRAFNKDWKITPTKISRGVSIGANATIVCGVELGEFSMIAAGSVVTKSVPRYALVLGNPARIVGYVCYCGGRLLKDSSCSICGKISNKGLNGGNV